MGIEINPQKQKNKAKLSKAGIAIITAIVLLVIIFITYSSHTTAKSQPVYTAIDQCVSVCKESAAVLGLSESDIARLEKNVNKEKNPGKKADLAEEMVTYVLRNAQDNSAVMDELTGARNRVFIAIKEYRGK